MRVCLFIAMCLLVPITAFCTEGHGTHIFTIHMDVQKCENPESAWNPQCVRYYPDVKIIACSVDEAMWKARILFKGYAIIKMSLRDVEEINKGVE